jgi:hypothetical protein
MPDGGSVEAPGRLGWRGRDVRDAHGGWIGEIEQLYVAGETTIPDWALVRTGGLGESVSFMPLHASRSDGGAVIVPFTRTQVTGAPRTPGHGQLSTEEKAWLYDHYGVNGAHPGGNGAGAAGLPVPPMAPARRPVPTERLSRALRAFGRARAAMRGPVQSSHPPSARG